MLFPVTGSTLILSAFAGPSVISNQGPGNIYLYRNSAVSSAAYDAVIGSGGTAQWPGGECWAYADQASTLVNVLNLGASIDSGSVTIAGTVKVEGSTGGGGTTPPGAISTTAALGDWSAATTTGNNVACSTPAGTRLGDLMVAYLTGASNTPVATGWDTVFRSETNFSDPNVGILKRVATAEDVGGGKSYTFANFGVSGSGRDGGVIIASVYNASGCATPVEYITSANVPSTQYTWPALIKDQLLLMFGCETGYFQPPFWSLDNASRIDTNQSRVGQNRQGLGHTPALNIYRATADQTLTLWLRRNGGEGGNYSLNSIVVPIK